jgi:hypothetical protein
MTSQIQRRTTRSWATSDRRGCFTSAALRRPTIRLSTHRPSRCRCVADQQSRSSRSVVRTEQLAAVDAATRGPPIRIAVNTDLHGDHTRGNAPLPHTTVIVGHPATRAAGILADTVLTNSPPTWAPLPDWGVDRHRAPTTTKHTDLSLFAGAREIMLRYPGYADHVVRPCRPPLSWMPTYSWFGKR